MQENLDVLISFVVVIIGLSVFLQIIVEVSKNILRLKWGVYENYLAEMYERFFEIRVPKKHRKIGTKRGEREKIGSVLDRFRDFQNTIRALAGYLRKMKKSLLNAERKIASLEIKKTDNVSSVIFELLEDLDPIISRIVAINFGDLFGIYNKLASSEQKKKSTEKLEKLQDEVLAIRELAAHVREGGEDLEKIKEEALRVIRRLIKALDDVEQFICHLHNRFSYKGESLLRDLENKYKQHITFWTIIIGVIMVAMLNADSVLIYQTLRNEPAVRASIVKKADMLTQHIDVGARSEAINELAVKVNDIESALEKKHRLNQELYGSFLAKYVAMSQSIRKDAEAYGELSTRAGRRSGYAISLPYNLDKSSSSFLKVLVEYRSKYTSTRNLTTEQISEIKSELDSALFRLTRNFAALQMGTIEAQKRLLYTTDLPLGWTVIRFKNMWQGPLSVLTKVLGLMMTVILISFGAPFWNDILKSLLGLKSFLRNPEGRRAGRSIAIFDEGRVP